MEERWLETRGHDSTLCSFNQHLRSTCRNEVHGRSGELVIVPLALRRHADPTRRDAQWCKPIGSIYEGGVEVANAVVRDDAVELLVSTKPIKTRGDSLNGGSRRKAKWLSVLNGDLPGTLLTVNLSSPAEDIIKVR